MMIMAHPPTAKGNFTLTSCRQAWASPPHRTDRPDHTTNNIKAQPVRLKALSAIAEAPAGADFCIWVKVTSPSQAVPMLIKAFDQGKARTTAPHAQTHGIFGTRSLLIREMAQIQCRLLARGCLIVLPQKPRGPGPPWDPA